jgi:hypothetical protein
MQKYLSVSSGSAHARLKLLGYYAQRVCTSRRLRRATTRAVIAGLGALHGQAGRAEAPAPAAVAALRTQGHVRLGQLLSAGQCAEILAWLQPRPMIAARANGQSFTLDTRPPGAGIGDFPLETVVNCPHVLDLANHPDLLALAGGYLGYTPVITLMGLRWSFPEAGPDADVQHFHRDIEPGSIKLLVYLTDVDDSAGPHRYVPRSHLDRMPLRMQRYTESDVLRRYGGSVAITGPAGTGMAIDNKGIHKGSPPLARPRLILVIQYSLLPCLIYDYAPVSYRGRARFSPYTNRLMVAPHPPASAARPMP